VDWKRWDWDHDTKTRFKLDGAHKKLNCYDCHSKPVDDAKLPMACVACHNADDVHAGSFGKQCERCHITKDWKRSKPARVRETQCRWPRPCLGYGLPLAEESLSDCHPGPERGIE